MVDLLRAGDGEGAGKLVSRHILRVLQY